MSKKTGDVVIPCDLSDNVKELHIFLYEDSAYTASDTVKQNSEKIVSDTGFKSATDIKKEGQHFELYEICPYIF